MLHGLERKGYLLSRPEQSGKRARRVYEIAPVGRESPADAKIKVKIKAKELFGELFEEGR
ncbi:hypothetical protein AAHK20_31215 [Trinickia sp. YCB016]